MICPLCKKNNIQTLYRTHDFELGVTKDWFDIVQCQNCGIVYTWPLLTAKEIYKYYPTYREIPARGSADTLVVREQYRKIRPFLKKKGKILDVGCSQGGFLFFMKKLGWDVCGIELVKGAATIAQRNDLKIIIADFDKVNIKTKYDLITFWVVLEHFRDPNQTLKQTRKLIKDQGLLVLEVPNFDSYQRRIFKSHWLGFGTPRHYFHYSQKTLSQLLAKNGFEVININFMSKAHAPFHLFFSLMAFLFPNKIFWQVGIKKNYDKLSKTKKFLVKVIKKMADIFIFLLKPLTFFESLSGHGLSMTIIARPKLRPFSGKVSLGVFAHNEEKDILKTLQAISQQELKKNTKISEIIVVADGCEDNTENIVKDYGKIDSRIKLLVQRPRGGKSKAINLFLKNAKEEIVILANADNIPDQKCLQEVLNPFVEKTVGLSGPQIVCINSEKSLIGAIDRLLWRLHDKISREDPKMGGFLALRKKIFNSIPNESAVDEATIEAMIKSQGFKIVYCSKAKLFLKGPERFFDYFRQRRRIHFGYFWLKEKYPNYSPSTFHLKTLFKAIFPEAIYNLDKIFILAMAAILEFAAKIFGFYDFKIKKSQYQKWPMISSSKGVKIDQPRT
jgi:glycosyltransferase involved in cell wall biosynthesis/SAM-dependent methyltransferase